jgi:hypothetical protein
VHCGWNKSVIDLQSDDIYHAGLNGAQLIAAKVQALQRWDDLKPSIQMMQSVAAEIDTADVRDILYRFRHSFQAEVIPQHFIAVLQYCPQELLCPFHARSLQHLPT